MTELEKNLAKQLQEATPALAKKQFNALSAIKNFLISIFGAKVQAPRTPQEQTHDLTQGQTATAGMPQHPAFKGPGMDGVAPDNKNENAQPNAEQTQEFMEKNPEKVYAPALAPAAQPTAAPRPAPTPKPPGG